MKKIQQHSITPVRYMEVSISTYKDWIYWMGTGLGLTYKFNNDLTSDELEKFSNAIKEATEVHYSL